MLITFLMCMSRRKKRKKKLGFWKSTVQRVEVTVNMKCDRPLWMMWHSFDKGSVAMCEFFLWLSCYAQYGLACAMEEWKGLQWQVAFQNILAESLRSANLLQRHRVTQAQWLRKLDRTKRDFFTKCQNTRIIRRATSIIWRRNNTRRSRNCLEKYEKWEVQDWRLWCRFFLMLLEANWRFCC